MNEREYEAIDTLCVTSEECCSGTCISVVYSQVSLQVLKLCNSYYSLTCRPTMRLNWFEHIFYTDPGKIAQYGMDYKPVGQEDVERPRGIWEVFSATKRAISYTLKKR